MRNAKSDRVRRRINIRRMTEAWYCRGIHGSRVTRQPSRDERIARLRAYLADLHRVGYLHPIRVPGHSQRVVSISGLVRRNARGLSTRRASMPQSMRCL
jgi:hypothetical protein